jgi:hypothetical protein
MLHAKARRGMNKRSITVILGIAVMLLTAMLWWRVRTLEKSVDSLTRQLQSKPGAFPVGITYPSLPQNEDRKSIFKLIDSAPVDDSKTKVGVPWNVERGMLLDGAQRNAPAENRRPTIIYEPPQSLPGFIDSVPIEAQPNGESN